ncbi:MAG: hypothetical protein WCM93_15020 [Bacteroidota bacterium]
MKKCTLFLIIVVFVSLTFSVKSTCGQTTQEEYNYVTKGYKTQIESGLDMKKGYSLKEITTASVGVRNVVLKGLYRTSSNVLCAIMIEYTKSGEATQYFCAPMTGSPQEIYTQFYNSLSDNDTKINSEERLQIIVYALSAACFK